MASRVDVDVDFSDSPRVAIVDAPSVEFVAQDIVDTLRLSEESFRGQTESKLLNASGKEDLGGGVSVGITVELQNTEIAFQGRTTPSSIGTITSTTGAGVADRQYMNDTNATFTTDGIHRGALVINFTDGSIAEVRNIISDIQLQTRPLVNGTTNLYTLGDDYQIFKVYQCEVVGGNVVAVDENGISSSPILPTAFTQVIRTASASATTQNLLALEHASYNSGVVIDVVNGVAGTDYPIGTGLAPSNNLEDAHAIADERGLTVFYVRGTLTIDSEDWGGNHIFKGVSPANTQIIISDPTNLENCEFWDAYVTGIIDANTVIRNSIVGSVTSYNGFIWESAIDGPITLGSVGGGETHIINSWANDILTSPPVIDMNGAGTSLAVRRYAGSFAIDNKTGPEKVSIDMDSGKVIINPTVTDGEIIVRGIGRLVDNSTGTTKVIEELVNGIEILNVRNMVELQRAHHVSTGDIFYWDPYSGNDTNEGDTPTRAVKTFAQAHALATDCNGDLIIAMASDPSGPTITTENLVITKKYLMVRGPGRDFQIHAANDALDGIEIQDEGVQISGMSVSTSPTNTKWAINTAGEDTSLKDLIVADSGNGIHAHGDQYCIFENVKVHHNTGIGVKVSGLTDHIDLIDLHIGSNGGSGLVVATNGGHEVNIIGTCVFHANGEYGIDIEATGEGVNIGKDTLIYNNTGGAIRDLGTNTYDARVVDHTDTAQAVWDYNAATVAADSMGEIQRRSAFLNHVHVDQNNGVAGTAYPIGTVNNPSNNIADAVIIASIEGLHDIVVSEDITIKSTDNISGLTLTGGHAAKSEFIIEAGAVTQLTQFFNCTLNGTLDGRVIVREAIITDVLDFEGVMFQTAIVGSVQLSTTPNAVTFILDCYSGVPGSGAPEIDFNFSPHSLAVRGFNGGLKFVNKTLDQPVTVDFVSGQLILDGTVTAGEIVVRGIYHIEDNSNGSPGITLVQNTNLDNIEIKIDNMQIDVDVIEVTVGNISLVVDDLIKYQRNKSIIDPINFTLTIYEDDGVTPLTTFNLQDDAGVASILSIFRRIPVITGSP